MCEPEGFSVMVARFDFQTSLNNCLFAKRFGGL
jgi:hypothetical protein